MIFFLLSFFKNKITDSFATNIDGAYFSSSSELRYAVLGGPLSKNEESSEKCKRTCSNQTECIGNICVSSFNSSTRDCYCSFDKKENMKEGFETLKNVLYDTLPISLPVWKYTSQNWTPTKRQQLATWSDLGITDINNMSISFWVYIKNENFDEQYKPILQISKPNYNLNTDKSLPWEWNDRYIGIWIYKNDDQKCSIVLANMTTNAVSDGVFVSLEYRKPYFCVISNNNNKTTSIYLNGKLEKTFYNRKGELLTPESNANILMTRDFNSIQIKDLQMYNNRFIESEVNAIYKSLVVTIPNVA
jgi:hypothetical protein